MEICVMLKIIAITFKNRHSILTLHFEFIEIYNNGQLITLSVTLYLYKTGHLVIRPFRSLFNELYIYELYNALKGYYNSILGSYFNNIMNQGIHCSLCWPCRLSTKIPTVHFGRSCSFFSGCINVKPDIFLSKLVIDEKTSRCRDERGLRDNMFLMVKVTV